MDWSSTFLSIRVLQVVFHTSENQSSETLTLDSITTTAVAKKCHTHGMVHLHTRKLRLYDDRAAHSLEMWENTYRIFFIYLLRATKVYDSRCPLPLRYFIFSAGVVVVVVHDVVMYAVVSFTHYTRRVNFVFVLFLLQKDYSNNSNNNGCVFIECTHAHDPNWFDNLSLIH